MDLGSVGSLYTRIEKGSLSLSPVPDKPELEVMETLRR